MQGSRLRICIIAPPHVGNDKDNVEEENTKKYGTRLKEAMDERMRRDQAEVVAYKKADSKLLNRVP